ncbi:DUF6884 domain-containing protein [Phorcysia thermohydrogeniphila]|uniref:DUF6884 domain-containing protein n=1 Tax=Phorcysia thermohydrogeniphila TaxID=936138 RepID=A0A4R1GDD3_9BACT|nr:DUF6884 domain-containing protein [Phorcysia thermohydrogeniphila]TCK04585.1 hypothetical protein CLV27_1018 [Phorcysia thermohydrogeniphila]
MKKKVVLVTACGNKKEEKPRPAGELYKSARIRHLYRKSKELGVPFFILSAGYGLVSGDEMISPYNAVMSEERCRELEGEIAERLKAYDVIVYYRGGARKDYLDCIKKVAEKLGKEFIVFGYGNMGDIGKLGEVLKSLGYAFR